MARDRHYDATTRYRRNLGASTRTSRLTAEEYRVKYLVGGNARHSRLLRYARMRRREARR